MLTIKILFTINLLEKKRKDFYYNDILLHTERTIHIVLLT